MSKGYAEGSALEERLADAERAQRERHTPDTPQRLAVFGSTADAPEQHFLGWAAEDAGLSRRWRGFESRWGYSDLVRRDRLKLGGSRGDGVVPLPSGRRCYAAGDAREREQGQAEKTRTPNAGRCQFVGRLHGEHA